MYPVLLFVHEYYNQHQQQQRAWHPQPHPLTRPFTKKPNSAPPYERAAFSTNWMPANAAVAAAAENEGGIITIEVDPVSPLHGDPHILKQQTE